MDDKAQAIEIPVEALSQRVTFTFSVDTKGNKLMLRQPSGQLIPEGSANTEDTELNCGRIESVTSPEAGNWRAEITGTGTFWMHGPGAK